MRLFAFLIAFAVAMPFAYDGDMDIYHEAKEDLALVRDGYITALNIAMDDANEGDPDGWFKARDNGECADWDDLEYVGPELEHFKLTEIPYGFQIKGRHGAYAIDVKIKVVTRDSDIFYDIQHLKGSNGPGKELVGEVFQNDRKVFYKANTPCTREAVTCVGEYSRGTLGTLKKKKAK
jgi:hypothetical protein